MSLEERESKERERGREGREKGREKRSVLFGEDLGRLLYFFLFFLPIFPRNVVEK